MFVLDIAAAEEIRSLEFDAGQARRSRFEFARMDFIVGIIFRKIRLTFTGI